MKRSRRWVERLRRLLREPRRLPLFVQAGLQVAAYRSLLPRSRLPRLLQRGVPVLIGGRRDADLLRDYAGWWLKHSPRPCLPRALTTYHALRRAGEQPQFVISVRREHLGAGAEVFAHAWVELGGLPYRETDDVLGCEWVEIFRHAVWASASPADNRTSPKNNRG